MKVEKTWYEAAAREIYRELKNRKEDKEREIKRAFEKSFWESEDGKTIQNLKEKFNILYNIPVLTFSIENYRSVLGKPISYMLPTQADIVDKLILNMKESPSACLKFVKELYLRNQQQFYKKIS